MEGEASPERQQWRTAAFRLGSFRVDPQRNRVIGADGETVLQPKVIDVLCALAEHHGEVLSRGELIDTVWGKEFGADESLTRAISQLRKVFGDARGEPQIIETIAKRGYRLIPAPLPADASAIVPATPERRSPRWAIAATAALVIAVTSLVVWTLIPGEQPPERAARTGIVVTVDSFGSDDPALPHSGLAGELSAELARSPLIRARTGNMSERGEPDTQQYRLRGELGRMGSQLRVSAQLVDSSNGEIVWGETYDRPYDPEFSARASVVAAISSDLFLPLLRAAKDRLSTRPASSLAPWEAVLLVTWVPGNEGRPPGPPQEDSYWLQRHALEIDPDFAPAHALFAELASYHALFHPPSDTQTAHVRAQNHADRALELAPYDAEVLYQLALHYRFSGDRDRAGAMLQRVLDLQPNHPLARIELDFVRGQCATNSDAQVASLTKRIRDLPPSSPARWVALSHLSALHLSRGEFEAAREAALASRQIIPMTWTAFTLAAADAATGRKDEAVRVLTEHRREWPNMDLRYFAERISARWCLGGPRAPQAQAIFRQLAATVGPAQK